MSPALPTWFFFSQILSGIQFSHGWSCASPSPSVHDSEQGSTWRLSPTRSPAPRSCWQNLPPLPLLHGGEGAPESDTDGPCAPLSLLTAALFPQERFVDLYGNNAAAEVRKGQETFNKWLLTGATVAGVLLLGSLLSRK